MPTLRHEMHIVWSEEDRCYLVHLPDFPEQRYRTHGDSYQDAARNGEEILQLLLEDDIEQQKLSERLTDSFA